MFQVEGRLFFRSKKTLAAICLLLAAILASSVLNGYKQQQAKSKVIDHYEQTIQQLNNLRQDLEKQYQKAQLRQEDYEAEEASFADYVASYQEELQAAKKEDWVYFYQKNIQHYRQDDQYISYAYEGYEVAPQTIENTVLVSKYLLEQDLPTAFPVDLFLTDFEEPKTQADREIIHSLGQQAVKGTSHDIWLWQKGLASLIMAPLFLLCFTDFFIKDQTGQNRQIRLLRTLGLSPAQMTRHKYLAFFSLYTGFFVSSYLLFLLLSALVNGQASWLYPITTYSTSNFGFGLAKMAISPIYQVVLTALCLHYLYLLLVVGTAQTLAKILKNSLAGAIVALALLLSASLYPSVFNPFSLWNTGQLADGSIQLYHDLADYSTTKVGLVFLLSLLGVYTAQFYLLTRQREV